MKMPQHDHDAGLQADLKRLNAQLNRRRLMGLFAGASLLPLINCAGDTSPEQNTSTADASSNSTAGCSIIPEETAGPYPGDGSNGPNALTLDAIVRSDIRSSIGTLSGMALGVPLTVRIQLLSAKQSCSPLAGKAIYLWHCDRDGKYSMYNLTDQNYLRGVQATDSEGFLSFVTIFPGCYLGRMPHMHFEVYPSLSEASRSSQKIKTSQIAFPDEVSREVYATSGYTTSASNFKKISFSKDNVFSDGVTLQMATITGSVADGLVATLIVAINS